VAEPRRLRQLLRHALALGLAALAVAASAGELVVGSKRFTESYILGEIVARTAAAAGEAQVSFKPGLGSTAIVYQALASGAIDVYPEYTGTIALEILRRPGARTLAEINASLAPLGLAAGVPLGFANSYGLAMREADAARLEVRTISDLARHPGLRLGLSQEFLGRRDGWPALKGAYALPFATPRGLDHGLAYEALAAGRIDVTDVYTTDAKIARHGLRVLEDDRRFFPEYAAVLLYRADLPQRLPQTFAALRALEGTLPAVRMRELNAAAEIDGEPFGAVAERFVASRAAPAPEASWGQRFRRALEQDFWRLAGEHLLLVLASLAASAVVGVPLGRWAARSRAAGAPILAAAGLLQTIPSLALLAALVAAYDAIGLLPALTALALYALLPIVRNTALGFGEVPRGLIGAGEALGLTPGQVLRSIEWPLALPSVLAGIRTSAVINVGTATVAAFIGAGGFGERIVAGLAVNDKALLLAGALPAAVLALLVEGAFAIGERLAVSPGLRARGARGRTP
jgi:osmoprotectant transport system permease protein